MAQQRQLDALARQQVELSALAESIEAFCTQVREGLAWLQPRLPNGEPWWSC